MATSFGAPLSGTGSHASTEPCGLGPSGFDPSHGSIRQFGVILDSFERMDRALASAEEILRDIKENHL